MMNPVVQQELYQAATNLSALSEKVRKHDNEIQVRDGYFFKGKISLQSSILRLSPSSTKNLSTKFRKPGPEICRSHSK